MFIIYAVCILLSGKVEVFAGSESGKEGYKNGKSAESLFSQPSGICIDPSDNSVLIAETSGHRIRRIKSGSFELRFGADSNAIGFGAVISVWTYARVCALFLFWCCDAIIDRCCVADCW